MADYRPLRPPGPVERLIDNMGRPTNALTSFFTTLQDLVRGVQVFEATINPTSVAANTTAEQTFTVTGLETDAAVIVSKPAHTTGLSVGNARVSAQNTLALTFANVTGSAIDPPEETYKVLAIRK